MCFLAAKTKTTIQTRSQMKKVKNPKKNLKKNPKPNPLMKFKQPVKNARSYDLNFKKNGNKKALS